MIPSGMERDSGHRIVEAVDSTRILVVDDDPIIQKALRRLFESEGYIVDIQRDGKAALDAFHSTAPAAVILDLRLPVAKSGENHILYRSSFSAPQRIW